jgi:hypothetical protein
VPDDNASAVCWTRCVRPGDVNGPLRVWLTDTLGEDVLAPIRRIGNPRLVVAAVVIALVLSCSSSSSTAVTDGALALGTWGGDSSGLIVSDTAMHLHIGCTFGDASGRIPVGGNGAFDVRGSYMLHAYPIAVGPSVPARFVGHVDGATATITAIIDDTVQHQTVTHGPVVVRFGDAPRLGPCPICRRPIVTRRSALIPIVAIW